MADSAPIVWRDLRRLYELGIMEEGEIHVEVELAVLSTAPGTLIVTDKRVLFFRSSLLSDRAHLVALPLQELQKVQSSERRSPIKKRGVLQLVSSPPGHASAITILEHIPGGKKRADEIARSILRQRELLSSAS